MSGSFLCGASSFLHGRAARGLNILPARDQTSGVVSGALFGFRYNKKLPCMAMKIVVENTGCETEKRVVFHGQTPDTAAAEASEAANSTEHIFLLSPANASGRRAKMLLNEAADSELARRLNRDGLCLGEMFSFMSSLYFRGKLTYARAFSRANRFLPGVMIITPSEGLLLPDTLIRRETLLAMASCKVDAENPRYRLPLEQTARSILDRFGGSFGVVLLGSIATSKYVEPLQQIFGERLLFPADFVGRGDMSRGALLLRRSEQGAELGYIPVCKANLRGPRPKKLPPIDRKK